MSDYEEKRFEPADAMSFDDGTSVDKAKNSKKTLNRLLHYMADQWLALLLIGVTILISGALGVAAPLILGQTVDLLWQRVQNAWASGSIFQVTLETMGSALILLLALYLLGALFRYIGQYIMASVAQTLSVTMRRDLSQKLHRLPLRYYDTHQKGDILSRATNDLEKVADSLQDGLMTLMSSIITIIGAVIMMLLISPLLTCVAALTLGISALLTVSIAKKSEQRFATNQAALGELNGYIEEMFTGAVIIKAFNREQPVIDRFNGLNDTLCHASLWAQFATYAISPVIRLSNQLGYVVIAVIGGILATQGTLSLGRILSFIQYVNQSSEPMTDASYTINMLQGAIASAERFFEVMDEPEESVDSEAAAPDTPQGRVAFQHVRFGYSDDHILMQDINLNLDAGATIAIVGPTGAGKTTLVNLLMRFYDLQGGQILIDGVDIATMPRSALRQLFGMVLQDTWLFQGTIADNIAYGKPGATEGDIIAAAQAARADHFIRTMPQGYQGILHEDGSNLSQGQKQLLTIARAILADPTILILDEATSSVDTRTEAEIQKAMHQLMQGRTSFVIAHRLSTIRDADLILVMKDGAIIEQGHHQQLLDQQGFYAELYNSQFTTTAQ